MLFSPHDGSREEPVCQGKACLIPAISIILLRKMSMEDACDIELLRKSLVDLRVHGTLLTGTLGCTSPRCLGYCADPSSPTQFSCPGATLSGTPAFSGTPASYGYARSFRSAYVPDKSACSGPSYAT